MNEVNWNDVCFILFLLICLGAAAHLPVCAGVLIAMMAFMFYVAFPLFILWGINVIFGGKVCMIVILLAIGIGIYYYISDKEMNKK